MDISSIFVTLGLALLATAYVLYPLYRGRKANRTPVPPATAKDAPPLLDSEQAARLSLQEVELDYQLGNITETDYRSLRERYMRRALVALKSRHDTPVGTDLSRPHPPANAVNDHINHNDHDEIVEPSISESEQSTEETDLDALIEEQLRVLREQQAEHKNDDGNEEHE